MKKSDSDTYPPDEAQQRLRAILKGAFAAPPVPLKTVPKQNGRTRAAAARKSTRRNAAQ